MLVLGVFGYQKRISKYKVKLLHEFTAQKKIIKIVTGIYRSTDLFTTTSSSKQAGIIFVYSKDRIQNAKVFRGCPGGVRHYSLERISITENPTQSQQNAKNSRLD